MKRASIYVAILAVVGAAAFWLLTAPTTVNADRLTAIAAHQADLANGENLFWAGGCASCHADREATGDEKLILSGGYVLRSEFGDFVAPNISSDENSGIGDWSLEEFANAMLRGVSPDGRHYYPAFPYASYAKMTDGDIADLFAFMKTLPASDRPSQPNQLSFPFNIRRGVGLWKQIYLTQAPVIEDEAASADPVWVRGRYLVESVGHCGECHSPRDFAGGLDLARWLEGAPNPSGRGQIPGITNADNHLADWSEQDIAYSLETGFTPEFDSLGGSMADVVSSYEKVAAEDRAAIAVYLKSLN